MSRDSEIGQLLVSNRGWPAEGNQHRRAAEGGQHSEVSRGWTANKRQLKK